MPKSPLKHWLVEWSYTHAWNCCERTVKLKDIQWEKESFQPAFALAAAQSVTLCSGVQVTLSVLSLLFLSGAERISSRQDSFHQLVSHLSPDISTSATTKLCTAPHGNTQNTFVYTVVCIACHTVDIENRDCSLRKWKLCETLHIWKT